MKGTKSDPVPGRFKSDADLGQTDAVSFQHSIRSRNEFVSTAVKSRPTSPRALIEVAPPPPPRYARIKLGKDYYTSARTEERESAQGWLDEPFREEDRSRAPTPPTRVAYPKDELERGEILANNRNRYDKYEIEDHEDRTRGSGG